MIIYNLKFEDNTLCNGFIIVGEGASNVWIDHNTFHDSVDEIIYVGSGVSGTRPAPQGVTISWNHMPDTPDGQGWGDKSILVSNPGNTDDRVVTITAHHNHYQTYVRHPYMRYAKFHAYNNYYNKNPATAQIEVGSQFYSENEVFECYNLVD